MLRKIILYLFHKFIRVDLPQTSDVSFDLSKVSGPQLLNIKAGCKAMVGDGTLALLVANRANLLKKHIALNSPDYHDVELHRVRLNELASLMADIARLSKPEQPQKDFKPNDIF